jgi:hypothetical protein
MNDKPKAEWPAWRTKPLRSSYPSGTLLGGMPYIPAANHGDASEFRKRQLLRQSSVKPIKGRA